MHAGVTILLVIGIPVQTMLMSHPRTDWAAVAPTTVNVHHLPTDFQKLCAHRTAWPSGTLEQWTPMRARELAISMVAMGPRTGSVGVKPEMGIYRVKKICKFIRLTSTSLLMCTQNGMVSSMVRV
jgi:hypothetical protein